jgi:hypothetical protein
LLSPSQATVNAYSIWVKHEWGNQYILYIWIKVETYFTNLFTRIVIVPPAVSINSPSFDI